MNVIHKDGAPCYMSPDPAVDDPLHSWADDWADANCPSCLSHYPELV